MYLQESDKIRLIRISSSLILDYLKKYNLNHTVSVFTPEIGIPDLLSEQELSNLFKINYNFLSKKESSILGCIILTLTNFLKNNKTSSQTQTDFNEEIEMKFKMIDQKYGLKNNLTEKNLIGNENDERMNFQRNLDKQSKIDIQNEVIIFLIRFIYSKKLNQIILGSKNKGSTRKG